MIPKVLFIGFGLMTFFYGTAQDSTITFDRPGIADSPYLVPAGSTQLETGIVYTKYFGVTESYLPSALVRMPLNKSLELRFGINYEPQALTLIKDNFTKGYDPISLGLKHKIIKEKEYRPEIAVSGNIFYPMQFPGSSIIENEINWDVYLLLHDNFNEKHALNYNFGFVKGGKDVREMVAWSYCYNYTLSDRITLFGEIFGYYNLRKNFMEYGTDAGIVFLLNDYIQIDASHIVNYTGPDIQQFSAVGFSVNIGK